MEAVIDLDTHVVVWLFAGLTARLSVPVQERLQANDLYVSPMVVLELQYLNEIGRTSETGENVVQDLSRRVGLRVRGDPFHDVITLAVQQTWTRDPFDRVIVGQSALHRRTLVTKDRLIREHYPQAFWVES